MLFRKVFGTSPVSVQTYGNVLTAIAFLAGMAFEELSRHELDAYDPYYPIVVAIRAVKPADREI